MNEKFYSLQRELIYPAFLGAALVGFAQPIVAAGRDSLTKVDLLWLFSGFWFVSYFSIAFLAFAETQPAKFGKVPFIANLIEVIVILAGSIAIGSADIANRN